MTDVDERTAVLDAARRAKEASFALAPLNRGQKDEALHAMADALGKRADEVLEANGYDITRAESNGTPANIVDRLTLTTTRLEGIADGLRQAAALPDPVGEVVRGFTLPNGLEVRQVRVPLGVVGIIYEARPNVTVDAAGLCLKSGNAALLRGSSSAMSSNRALVGVLRDAIADVGLPADAITLVPGESRESVKHLMTARGLVDVLIPRGGADLIRSVVEGSTVPVIETGAGTCHVYVDAQTDVAMAVSILLNSKTQRTSVCNSAETLLVHKDAVEEFLPAGLAALRDAGVVIHADERATQVARRVGIDTLPATEDDWYAEYLALEIAVRVVDSLEDAAAHIRTYGTAHTEAIVTTSQAAARRFVALVDSAAVMVNASTRFTDGGEFGFGAEIGISTQKLHARGPMALPELTSTKYVVTGEGQVRV